MFSRVLITLGGAFVCRAHREARGQEASQLSPFSLPHLPLSDVPSAALPDLCAEAVSAAEGLERSLHRGNQLVQSHPHGHQFPAGTVTGYERFLL